MISIRRIQPKSKEEEEKYKNEVEFVTGKINANNMNNISND